MPDRVSRSVRLFYQLKYSIKLSLSNCIPANDLRNNQVQLDGQELAQFEIINAQTFKTMADW